MKLEFAMRQRRLATLRANMAALHLDAVAIVPGANFHYLTGGRFSSMERPTILVIPAEGEVRAILPALELLSWDRLEIDARVHAWRDSDGYAGACAAAVAGLRPRRLGVEGQRMRVFEELALRAAWPRAGGDCGATAVHPASSNSADTPSAATARSVSNPPNSSPALMSSARSSTKIPA